MTLDPEICHQALRARDARFDGRFFVGITTTGIYCRPVCPARSARREHRRFFPSAAAAEAGGFRPCLRCRPELAPGNALMDATQRLAYAAAALIAAGQVGAERLPLLARRLGITDRHLRRVFKATFGVTPVAWAQTQRLLLAKQLITDTRLPVIEVAMASGFTSLRRCNALFRQRYHLSPLALRRALPQARSADGVVLHLAYRPPLDWPRLQGFLARRAIPGLESWRGDCYRCGVRLAAGGRELEGWIEVRPSKARRHSLSVHLAHGLLGALPQALARIGHLFDLGCHPQEVMRVLGALAGECPGLRLPGCLDGFEMAVRVVLGQQVSVPAARTLGARLVARFGREVQTPWADCRFLFPQAARLAGLRAADLAAIGIVSQRARAIIGLARRVAADELDLEPHAPIEHTLEQLSRIPGIGPWTAQVIAMRALAWPDAFPHTDLGVMKALRERRPARVLAAAAAWRPWRAYAVMHLWQRLEEETP